MIMSVIPLPQRIEPGSFLDGVVRTYDAPESYYLPTPTRMSRFQKGRMLHVPNVGFIKITSSHSGFPTHVKYQDLYSRSFQTEHVFAVDRRYPIDYRNLSIQTPNGVVPLLGVPITVKVMSGLTTRTYLFARAIEYLLNHSDHGTIDLINPPNDLVDDPTRLSTIPPRHLLTVNQFLDKVTNWTTQPLGPICNVMCPDAPWFVAQVIDQVDRIMDVDPNIPHMDIAIDQMIAFLDEALMSNDTGSTLVEFVGGDLLNICDPITIASLNGPVVNLQQFLPWVSADVRNDVGAAIAMASSPLLPNVRIDPGHIVPSSEVFLRFVNLVRQIPYDFYSLNADRTHAGGHLCSVMNPTCSDDADGTHIWCGEMIVNKLMDVMAATANFAENTNLKMVTLMKTSLDEIWYIQEMVDGSAVATSFPLALEALLTPSIIDDFVI